MSLHESTVENWTFEECLDEINDFVRTLDRYPPRTIAMAIRIHLENLLCALRECGLCTRSELKEFLRELERDVLEHEDD
jgi:hypothetical protein